MPAGLVPCNVIADEILGNHPRRFRAMMIDSSNPAHSLADSAEFRRALAAPHSVGFAYPLGGSAATGTTGRCLRGARQWETQPFAVSRAA
jgi:hypothetical protein